MADHQPDIEVFNESGLSIPVEDAVFSQLASGIADHEGCSFTFIEVVYVDAEEIVRLNQEHLGRDYITDIITFRYDEDRENRRIEGSLFCCAPRIQEQAAEFNEPAEKEFQRIFIHGLLHLAGYDDQSEAQKQQMTEKEDFYLGLAR